MCVPTLVAGLTSGTCVARFTSASVTSITAGLNPVTFFVGLQAILSAALGSGITRLPNGFGANLLISPDNCGGNAVWCMDNQNLCISGKCRCSNASVNQACAPGYTCVTTSGNIGTCEKNVNNCPGQFLCIDLTSPNGLGYTCVTQLGALPAGVNHCGQCGLRCAAGQTCVNKVPASGVGTSPACTCTTHTQCPPGFYCMRRHPLDPDTSSSCQPFP
jgi:hypothetical protein